jgi:hypothetical protein
MTGLFFHPVPFTGALTEPLRVEGVRGQVEWIYESKDIIGYLEYVS